MWHSVVPVNSPHSYFQQQKFRLCSQPFSKVLLLVMQLSVSDYTMTTVSNRRNCFVTRESCPQLFHKYAGSPQLASDIPPSQLKLCLQITTFYIFITICSNADKIHKNSKNRAHHFLNKERCVKAKLVGKLFSFNFQGLDSTCSLEKALKWQKRYFSNPDLQQVEPLKFCTKISHPQKFLYKERDWEKCPSFSCPNQKTLHVHWFQFSYFSSTLTQSM